MDVDLFPTEEVSLNLLPLLDSPVVGFFIKIRRGFSLHAVGSSVIYSSLTFIVPMNATIVKRVNWGKKTTSTKIPFVDCF